ncbi:cytochrome ubiquinol oxidase subunit I [Nocardioides bruguierae]|uniref:Cytochrome ubiquinol oxidase subunit I n=1 Tax=Nocardioides bruguierae TaxID=2945102 RepID=A0A9X2D6J9_9ACTN|nr:cytochrome ubiquinol oxidase subunit I [Nocardioides bruguierae]MCM0620246.1 cytochrome ubiquinol oxidase subunit I [Nocardioides bruguierae]
MPLLDTVVGSLDVHASLTALTSLTADASSTADPAGLLPARQQMALSLGWHIILACFGVAFPTIILAMHWRGVYREDADAMRLARRWSKVSAVLFAIGAVSGTVLSFEMGLLWPGLMGTFGDVLGLPFAFEGLAFFLEAIFIGLYLYGWDRMKPKVHLLMLVPMAITGVVGTFCVLAVNAWMNEPTGFDIVDGEVTNIQPWAAFFNDRVWLQFGHMWVATFMVAGFCIAAVYAVGMLKGRRDRHHRLGFIVPFVFASVAAISQPVVGHFLGAELAEIQPSKLAAMELATTSESPSPMTLGGYVNSDGEKVGAIEIPYLGSIIAMESLSEPVPSLDEFAEEDLPPVNLTHWSFQIMIGLGMLLMGLALIFWFARWRKWDLLDADRATSRWFLRIMAFSGIAAIAAMETGWITTEVGRQPWIVYGVMRTPEAAGDNSGLWWLYWITVVVYTLMTIGAIVVLRSMAKRWRRGDESLPSPYGPELETGSATDAAQEPAR